MLELEREPLDGLLRVPAPLVPLARLDADARDAVVFRPEPAEPDARDGVVFRPELAEREAVDLGLELDVREAVVFRLEVEVRDGLREAVVLRVPLAFVAVVFRVPVAFVPVARLAVVRAEFVPVARLAVVRPELVPVARLAVVRPELALRLVPVVFFAAVPLDRVPALPRVVVLLCVVRLAVLREPAARVVPAFRVVPVVAFFAVVPLERGLAVEPFARVVVRPDVVRPVVDSVFADAERVEPLVVFRGVGAIDIPLSLAGPSLGPCVPPGRLGSSFGANRREHESGALRWYRYSFCIYYGLERRTE